MGLMEFLFGQDLVDAVSGVSNEDLTVEVRCNHCGSTNLSANGGKNVNKYSCKSCFTGTSDTAGTVWHKTHLPPEKRAAIEEAHREGKSRRKAAEEIGVCRATVTNAYNRLDNIPRQPKPVNRFALFGQEDLDDDDE